MAMLCRILPYHVVPELPDKSTLSYEETVAQLRERGLPPELINHLRKAPPPALPAAAPAPRAATLPRCQALR
jgi:hypothetical protein